MSEEKLLELREVSVFYPGRETAALDHLSLSLSAGEILMIVGESGSGKSTLLRSLMGLLPSGVQVSGKALFSGKDLYALSEKERARIRGREIGMIFQNPGAFFDPRMKIGGQFTEMLRIHLPLKKKEAYAEALKKTRPFFTEPERILNSFPHELSGGQLQRAAVAMAAALPTEKLLLCDEPTSALDVSSAAQTAELLKELSRERNMALLIVTHNLSLALSMGDRIAVLRGGKLIEEGSAQEIHDAPKEEYTRRLLKAVPKLRSSLEREEKADE